MVRNLTLVATSCVLVLSGCSGSSSAERSRPPDELVVLPSDLPKDWGHIPQYEQAGTLTPPLESCVAPGAEQQPVHTGEAFSYSNDSIHTFLYQSTDDTAAAERLSQRRSQVYRDCVKATFEAERPNRQVDVTSIAAQNDNEDTSAIVVKRGGYKTYVVTVTKGRNEVLIEGSASDSIPEIDDRFIAGIATKVRSRL